MPSKLKLTEHKDRETVWNIFWKGEKNKNHTTFHKVRIRWHGVSASITVEACALSNKDTGGTAAFQREE